MASVVQRLGLFWTSNSGQARADIGRVGGSFMQLGGQMGQAGRQSTLVNSQMRALGTTLKYALSGAVIFGGINAIRNLAGFNKQLGMISATGVATGLNITGNALSKLTNQIYQGAVETITPVNDFTDAIANYVSHVQGQPTNQIVPSMVEIAKAATVTRTPIEDMTVALTTMNRAFGIPISTKSIQDLAGKWTQFIFTGPATANVGPKIIQQLGPLAASARTARIDPGQMMTMLLANLQFGIAPQQASSGLRYLMQTLFSGASAGTKQQQAILGSFGITTQSVQQKGGYQTLIDIFKHLQSMGGIQNISKVNRALAGQDNTVPDVKSLSIGGSGLTAFAQLFKSRFALRSAVALYQLWTTGQLDKDLKSLGDSTQSVADQQHKFAKEWANFAQQSQLSKAAIAMQAAQLQMTKALGPVFGFVAQAPIGIQKEMTRHPAVTRVATEAAAGILALMGINKLTGGRLSRIPGLNRVPGFRNVGSGLLNAKITEDTIKGLTTNTPGLSPENPLYVVVVKQLFQGNDKSLPSTEKSLAQKVLDEAKNPRNIPGATGIGALLARFGGWRGLGRAGLMRVGLPALAGFGLAEFQKWAFGGDGMGLRKGMVNLGHSMYFSPRLGFLSGHGDLLTHPGSDRLGVNRGNEIWAARHLHTTFQNIQKLERATNAADIAAVLKSGNDKLLASIAQGNAGFTLDLTIVDNKGKVTATKRVHLPPDTFSGGKTPGSRGTKKVMKVTTSQ